MLPCCHAACQLSKWVASSSTHTNQTFNRLCSMVGQLVGAPAAPHACSVRKAASHQQGMCTGHVEKRVPCTLLAACTRQPARLTSQEENPRFHHGNTSRKHKSMRVARLHQHYIMVPDSARQCTAQAAITVHNLDAEQQGHHSTQYFFAGRLCGAEQQHLLL